MNLIVSRAAPQTVSGEFGEKTTDGVTKYGDVRLNDELQMSLCEGEAKAMLEKYAELSRNKAPAQEKTLSAAGCV